MDSRPTMAIVASAVHLIEMAAPMAAPVAARLAWKGTLSGGLAEARRAKRSCSNSKKKSAESVRIRRDSTSAAPCPRKWREQGIGKGAESVEVGNGSRCGGR